MPSSERRGGAFGALVVANLLASGAHFTHNAVFLDVYPGPLWIQGPGTVVAAWCVAAAILVAGYVAFRRGRIRFATAAVAVYGAVALSVFGHYVYGPPADFDLLTNALIVGEGMAGIALLAYFVPLAARSG